MTLWESPGSHDNFSTSDAPENYLPQFLAQKFPYDPGRGFKKPSCTNNYNKVTTMEVDEYLFKEGYMGSEITILN